MFTRFNTSGALFHYATHRYIDREQKTFIVSAPEKNIHHYNKGSTVNTKYAVGIIIALVVVFIVLKSCEGTKKVEILQKSTDDKSTLTVEIKKEKPEDIK